MAELEYSYLYEEIELSGDLIPCEFCDDLFPFSIIIEHQQKFRLLVKENREKTTSVDVQQVNASDNEFKLSGCTSNPLNQKPQESFEAESNEEKILKASPVKENAVIRIEQMVTNEHYNFQVGSTDSVLKKVLDSDDTLSASSKQYITFKDQDDSGTDEETSSTSPQHPHSDTETMLSDDDNEENETIESYLFKASIKLSKRKMSLSGALPKCENLYSKKFDEQEKTICSPHHNFSHCF